MRQDVSVDPPVMKDDELFVECDNSSCPNSTYVGTDIDAVEASQPEGWRLSFQPTVDGRLELSDVECPEHRIDDAIDDLATTQKSLSNGVYQALEMVDRMNG